jgi:hypothetical protein
MSSDWLYISRSPRVPYATGSPTNRIELDEWENACRSDPSLVTINTYKGFSSDTNSVVKWIGHSLTAHPGQFLWWWQGMVVYDYAYMDVETLQKLSAIASLLGARLYDIEGNDLTDVSC